MHSTESRPMRERPLHVGILGGTFDPIHIGHLLAAEAAREGAALDEVWLLPANVPPHKAGGTPANAEHRWQMALAAAADNPFLQSCDLELRKGGVSYTIDTIMLLKERYPDINFSFIIGGDMVAYLPQWHRIDEICRLTRFIGLQRPGYPNAAEGLPEPLRQAVMMVHMPLVDISSTAIRERRRLGQSIRYQVTDAVYRYIEGNGLYEPEP
jgi:nicotinate-nucleotide adenylyltransferase